MEFLILAILILIISIISKFFSNIIIVLSILSIIIYFISPVNIQNKMNGFVQNMNINYYLNDEENKDTSN